MSLEDIHSELQSDDSSDEAEQKSPRENDFSTEPEYIELVDLHRNLMCFDNIYINNAYIDWEVRWRTIRDQYNSLIYW